MPCQFCSLMKQKVLFIFFFFLLSLGASAQKEAARWFFGRNSGLNFVDTQTVTDDNGVSVDGVPTNESSPLNTDEGCFSVSDKNGNIIVFSDGMEVYNKDKTRIATGLNGNRSSAQSGIIIPYPETPGKYFIISNKQSSSNLGGLYYSIFDSSGSGTITSMNTPINQTSVSPQFLYENITSVRHANGKDFWLLNRTAGFFFAWHITKDGFPASVTKVSSIPSTQLKQGQQSQGYMKMSPDGKMVCHVCIDAPNGEVMFADFNNETGEITNIILRHWQKSATVNGRLYSLEFSPKGNNLFLSYFTNQLHVIPTNQILTGTPQPVAGAGSVGTVQTGPDGRLYGIQNSSTGTKLLAIIPNPDDDISQITTHIFSNYLSGTAMWGLPSFVSSFFYIEDIETNPELPACRGTQITFSAELSSSHLSEIAYLEWDFGDGNTTGPLPFSSGGGATDIVSQTHTYKKSGTYTLTLTPYKIDNTVITGSVKTREVKISPCMIPINPNVSSVVGF